MSLAPTHTLADGRRFDGVVLPAVFGFWTLVALTVLASFLVALPNLADPMIRHDDYPAYFSDADMFWAKTLHEGRWLNWAWHLRGVVTPAWLNFAVYQALWAVFAASLAFVTLRDRTAGLLVLVLAVLIVVAPPARLISLWFNTLIPGIAVVALFGVMATVVSQRSLRVLLLPFTIISFMAYTTYPVLLLAICLASTRGRSIRDLACLLVWFAVCFAAAVLAVYTLNFQVHGVFGVPLDDWRNASPASDIGGMLANLPVLGETFVFLAERIGFTHPVVNAPSVAFFGFLFVASTLTLARRAPLEALYLHAGLWTGIALMVLQSLKLGVVVPPRAFIFVWVFFALVLVRAVCVAETGSPALGRWMRNGLAIVLVAQVISNLDAYVDYRSWQADTRTIAAELAPGNSPVLVSGSIRDMPSADRATLQHELAFAFRMQMLTGRDAIFCDTDPEVCAKWEDSAGEDVLNRLNITRLGGDVSVRLVHQDGSLR